MFFVGHIGVVTEPTEADTTLARIAMAACREINAIRHLGIVYEVRGE